MSKYKNVGKDINYNAVKKGEEHPKTLMRYGDKSQRTSKSYLTKGAFGCPHEES